MTREPDTSPQASPASAEPAASDSRLRWTPADRAAVERHAQEAYPHECCGVLLGEPLPGGGEGGVVTAVRRLDNEREDSRHNRYLIRPEAVLAAEREARSRGISVLGWYHSHPDHPAVPSEFDREHAWPGMSYVIVSVEEGSAVATRSWRLTEDRTRFDEESLLETEPQEVVP